MCGNFFNVYQRIPEESAYRSYFLTAFPDFFFTIITVPSVKTANRHKAATQMRGVEGEGFARGSPVSCG